jgi:hypothetical protein
VTAMSILHRTPLPGTVTATPTAKENPVAVIKRGTLRLGTMADAGRECVTSNSPHGVSAETYRTHKRDSDAPGPYMVRDPITEKLVPARDEHGRELYNLDAVAAWNRRRPGEGRWAGRPLRKLTPIRWKFLTAAQDGRLSRAHVEGRGLRPFIGDDEMTSRAWTQRLTELIDANLIDPPRDEQGPYQLTDAGQRWLEQHRGDYEKAQAKQSKP